MPLIIRLYAKKRWGYAAPDEETAREAARRLGDIVRAECHGLLSVTVTGNRRTYVSLRTAEAGFHLRVHWVLLPHAEIVAAGVANLLRHGRYSSELLDRIRLSAREPGVWRAGKRLQAAGFWRDLRVVLSEVIPFADRPVLAAKLDIGWGRAIRRGQRTLRLGGADVLRGRIVIHPTLDAPDVPDMVVEMVVWHELCHCLEPPLSHEEARRHREHRVHHSGFRQLEARYPNLDEANRWVRQNLGRLLAPP